MTRLDPSLLAAFAPEFATGCDRLATAADAAGAARALDALRGMAGAFGIASLVALIKAATTALDPFDATVTAVHAATLRARSAAIVAAGRDVAAIRILIVDDSALMRRLLREILAVEPSLHVVAEAADGAAALALMAEHTPDVTLLDIEMPVLDGFGVLRQRALAGGGGAVVVVSSAAPPGSPAAILARRLGARAVVGKPSGAVSPDLARRSGAAIRQAVRDAVA
ncbi:response regulator [Humitalea sp. 24SJ18S-53]|uniref:response regulator n=1 Tax=Humitalea sp. 24SJ18S-53 TaxID=3422307 RepID=UPI003D670BF2